MVRQRIKKLISGQLIVELLLAFGLSSILLPALLTGFVSAVQGREVYEQRLAATALLREPEEAVRSFRNEDWQNIAGLNTSLSYYPSVSGTKWTLTSGTGPLINGFTRTVAVSDVYRDANKNIVAQGTPGATLDPSTRKFLITVSWPGFITRSVDSTLYLSRWKNAISSVATTGTLSGMGHGDWCNPNLHITPYDISGNGIGIAISSVAGSAPGVSNGAYISTGNNASSYSMYSINITDPPYPASPSATTANTHNSGKNYGLYANTNYVYVATGNVPGAPKRVVDILNKSNLTSAGYFDASSNLTATSVYVSGTSGYVTAATTNGSASYLISFTATPVNGTSSQSQLWQKALTGNAIGNKVVVSGDYAFIATNATSLSRQLQVVRLSDQTIYSPPGSGTGSINTTQPGVDIAILGNYAYLITNYSSSSTPDIFIIDITSPTAPRVVGSANTFFNNTSMLPLGVATTPNNANKLIVVGDGGWQYQTFNVVDPTNPVRCGNPLQNPNGASKIQAVSTLREEDGDVYSYTLTSNGSAQQFQIMEGGAGGAGGNGGVFESPVFDAGHSVVFNSFKITSLDPSTITANFQVAVSSDCSTFNYVGSYDANGGTIPLTINPGRCFRYKVTFTNGLGATQATATVSINYSP